MNHRTLRLGVAILLSALLCGLSFEMDVLAKKKPKRRRPARTVTSQRPQIVLPTLSAILRLAVTAPSNQPKPSAVKPNAPSSILFTAPPSAAAGDLDTSFSTDGKQNTDITTADDRALAVAIQTDGKIVVAGYAFGTPGSPGTNNSNFMVARYNTDGSLDDGTGADATPGDGAFATAGVFVADFSGGEDRAQAIAIQTDGKIVVAGVATVSSFRNFALMRLTATGAPDNSFDTDGKLVTDVSPSAHDEARAVAIQSDGKIIAAGETFNNTGGNDFGLVRYNTNGSLDDNTINDSTPGDSYGTGGKVITDFFGATADVLNAMVLQSDGKAVAAGRTYVSGQGGFNFVLARYTTAGLLDTTFGATDGDGLNGVTMTDFDNQSDDQATSVAIQSDGKIVAGGKTSVITNPMTFAQSYAFALTRYNTDGSLDDGGGTDTTPLDTFDADGKRVDDFTLNEDVCYAIAIHSDGKIAAAGVSNSDSGGSDLFKDFRVARYTTTGALDSGFGSGGSITTDFDNAQDEAFGVAIQSDGKMVAAGVAQIVLGGGFNIGLARYDGGAPPSPPAAAGDLIISEFRLRGPGGVNDEFIEIYNTTPTAHTVSASSGSGYGIAASDGVTRCSIPNGTSIPSRGHYLCVNSVGYSLATYPAGNGTTAAGDATYTTDIPDNAGIAIFNNDTGGGSYSLANRLDAVGSTSEANALYREGGGLAPLAALNLDYAWLRDTCGKSGSVSAMGLCTRSTPKDTNDNAGDFFFVDTAGLSAGAGQRLGAPGPENLSSPIQRNASFGASLLDPCVADSASPNRERVHTSDPGNNSTFGTLEIRRTVTNNTGANVTRLRWRVIDISTSVAPAGLADLRVRSSSDVPGVIVDRAPCGSGTSSITVRGTTLETPPTQGVGGGFNSSLSSGTVTLATPLANGASIDVRFLLGVQKTGAFKIYLNIEALP